MSLDDQNSGQFIMKDPMFTPPMSDNDRVRIHVVSPNLDAILGLKEHGKEAGVENVIKQLSNGHALLAVKRVRVRGFCVCCIRNLANPNFKKVLSKVVTHCPACPGGIWICESCFDKEHNVTS